jgi:hypothetical protein
MAWPSASGDGECDPLVRGPLVGAGLLAVQGGEGAPDVGGHAGRVPAHVDDRAGLDQAPHLVALGEHTVLHVRLVLPRHA